MSKQAILLALFRAMLLFIFTIRAFPIPVGLFMKIGSSFVASIYTTKFAIKGFVFTLLRGIILSSNQSRGHFPWEFRVKYALFLASMFVMQKRGKLKLTKRNMVLAACFAIIIKH